MARTSWTFLALAISLASAKQASAFCLANRTARSWTTLKPDVISFAGIAPIHMPVACTMASMNWPYAVRACSTFLSASSRSCWGISKGGVWAMVSSGGSGMVSQFPHRRTSLFEAGFNSCIGFLSPRTARPLDPSRTFASPHARHRAHDRPHPALAPRRASVVRARGAVAGANSRLPPRLSAAADGLFGVRRPRHRCRRRHLLGEAVAHPDAGRAGLAGGMAAVAMDGQDGGERIRRRPADPGLATPLLHA